MAIFKCKMCGGSLEIVGNASVAECEYCGTKQTLPKTNDDVVANLFNRANNLRLKCEFDKAAQIYEKIVEQDSDEAEAYWGMVLCKYGIEYVEDPKTMTRVPTCHRTLYEAVTADADYLAAMEHANTAQRDIYEKEAQAIDRIQKDILAVVKNEKPFDVFICYKESDDSGKRTVDSSIANDIYHQLTQEGFKVFYAAITLEDKLGQEYEPYIFAALNSAKVMLVLGTKPEYFSAVWVRNEWSRFLQLMKSDRSKLLIPCYRDMDAYDLPEEFSHLQAQDMSKLGFVQDLIRGIKKIAQTDEPKTNVVKETVVTAAADANIAPLLKRVFMFLEDGDWNSANEYCEKVLDIDPECADAYLGKLMVDRKARNQEDLKKGLVPFDNNVNYQKLLRFGDEATKQMLQDCIDCIKERKEQNQRQQEQEKRQQAEQAEQQKKKRIAKLKEAIDKEKTEQGLWRLITRLADGPRQDEAEELIAYAKQRMEVLQKQIEELADRIKACPPRERSLSQIQKLSSEIKDAKEEKAKLEQLMGHCEADFARLKQLEQDAAENSRNWTPKQEKLTVMQEAVQALQTERAALGFFAGKQKKELDGKIATAKAELAAWETEIAPDRDKTEQLEKALAQQKANLFGFSDAKQLTERIVSLNASITALEENLEVIKNSDPVELAEKLAKYKSQSMAARTALAKVAMEEKSRAIWAYVAPPMTIAASVDHSVSLKPDGTVRADGRDWHYGELNVSDWKDIVSVAAGRLYSAGLKSDGTVVNTNPELPPCRVSYWKDIVAIVACAGNTFGLRSDGTVLYAGWDRHGESDVSGWRNIVAVATSEYHAVGLKSDGTVVAVGNNKHGECDVSGWRDIVAVAACSFTTVGLKSDGTVVTTRYIEDDDYNTSGWRYIIAIATTGSNVYGLKADGSAIDRYDLLEWKNIVAITSGEHYTLGLKSDGTVVDTNPEHKFHLYKVRKWKDIKVPD